MSNSVNISNRVENERMELSEILRSNSSILLHSSNSNNIADRLKLIEWFCAVIKSRILFVQAKCNAALGSSRYLTNGNATVVEQDYDDNLFALYGCFDRKYLDEIICNRIVENKILLDIVQQNVNLNDSFPIPRPPMQDGARKEKKVIESMKSIADLCVTIESNVKDTNNEIENYLDDITKNVDQIEKFMLYKERRLEQFRRKKCDLKNESRSNAIRKTNIVRGLITAMLSNSKINYFEHPDLVDVIRQSRDVVTEKTVEREIGLIMPNHFRALQM